MSSELDKVLNNRNMWMGIAVKRKEQLEELEKEQLIINSDLRELERILKVVDPDRYNLFLKNRTERKKPIRKHRNSCVIKFGSLKNATGFTYYDNKIFYTIPTSIPSNLSEFEVYEYFLQFTSDEKFFEDFPVLKEKLQGITYKGIRVDKIEVSGRNWAITIKICL